MIEARSRCHTAKTSALPNSATVGLVSLRYRVDCCPRLCLHGWLMSKATGGSTSHSLTEVRRELLVMDLPGHASKAVVDLCAPGTSKISESASASIAASDCQAAAGADRESSCGGRSVGESLPEPLHLFRPVTQDTGSKIAILSFGGRGHGQPLSSIHVDEVLKVMDDEQRASTRDDRPPDLGGMSLAEVGLAQKSHLLTPRSEPAASVVNFVLRHSGLEREGYRTTFSPLRSRFAPQRLKYRSRWRQEGLNLARPRGGASLNEYIQKAGLETWTFLVTRVLNFVYSGRHGDRADRPETSSNSEMNTKQFEQQSSQVLGLSANIHFTQKDEKYMQNGQLLKLKGKLQEQLSYLTSLQFDQDLQR